MASSRSARQRRLHNVMRGGLAIVVSAAVLGPGFPVVAQPVNPDDAAIARTQAEIQNGTATVSGLAGEISRSQEEVNRLELEIGALRESVNKALVDLHDAQATAEQARQAVTASRERLEDTQTEIDAAQGVMDEISRSAYRNGAKSAAVTNAAGGDSAEDALDRRTFLRVSAEEQRTAIDKLDALRTRQANEESQLRAARDLAEQREAEAEGARADTEAQIGEVNTRIAEVTGQRDQLVAARDTAQAELDQSRQTAEQLDSERREYEEYLTAESARKAAEEAAAAAAEERRQADAAAEQAEAEAAAQSAADTPATTVEETAPAEQTEAAEEPEPESATTTTSEPESTGLAASPYADGAREQAPEDDAADEAAAAARAADQARVEAEQAAEREAAAEQLRDTAVAAATAATAALVAQHTADHTTLDSPYPAGENNPDVPIAAVQNPGSSQGSSEPAEPEVPEVELAPVNTFTGVSDEARETVSGSREEQIETVIARAKTQIGVPYAWGGGDANGPTQGIRDGGVADSFGDYDKVGFDCSGLVVYAFAGVGIALPHYTGYQYNHGKQVDPGNMQRGDLIFYGPEAEHHVAIYLGDGKMIEAPQSGSSVQISDVRFSGMSPSVVRLV